MSKPPLTRAQLLDLLLAQLRTCSISDAAKDNIECRLNLTTTENLQRMVDEDTLGQAELAVKNPKSFIVH